MSERARVEAWFADGTLVRPVTPGQPTSVDLVRALFRRVGGPDVPKGAASERLLARIQDAEHYVVLLIDGLGARLLERFRPTGFLRSHQTAHLNAVFPSTTAAALTSLATGEYPARHGVMGWWQYLDEYDITATVLPFVERFGGRDLREVGVLPSEVFTFPSRLPGVKREVVAVVPASIVGTPYTEYTLASARGIGYEELSEAFEAVGRCVLDARAPSYVSAYIPHLDELAHEEGLESTTFAATLRALDDQVAELAGALQGRARLIVTGDHGHVTLRRERVLFLDEGDELLGLLRCPPTGEATVPYFHVRPGRLEAFREGFEARFGTGFALLTREEAEAMSLFGPGSLSDVARRRLGDLVGIAPRPTALVLRPKSGEVHVHRSVHAGLSGEEMRVPLIVV